MIEVKHISKAFGGLRAVSDCSLKVETGTITGLVGPNGAGKSTLFSIIAGFQAPDEGSVVLDNENITGTRPDRLFHAGLVRTFQTPHEFSLMSVRENLMLVPAGQAGENLFNSWFRWGKVLQQSRQILDRVDEVLEFLHIDHVADELAGNLSGGQKKLLELGRTMMTDAKVVLLDEPGAGVNPTLKGALANAIKRLNEEKGYTFCLIEHDMDLIADLCSTVIVMANGTVIAQGSMDEIRANEEVREAYLGHGESA